MTLKSWRKFKVDEKTASQIPITSTLSCIHVFTFSAFPLVIGWVMLGQPFHLSIRSRFLPKQVHGSNNSHRYQYSFYQSHQHTNKSSTLKDITLLSHLYQSLKESTIIFVSNFALSATIQLFPSHHSKEAVSVKMNSGFVAKSSGPFLAFILFDLCWWHLTVDFLLSFRISPRSSYITGYSFSSITDLSVGGDNSISWFQISWLPDFFISSLNLSLNSRFVYPTAYLIISFGCQIGISHVTCLKWYSWSSVNNFTLPF